MNKELSMNKIVLIFGMLAVAAAVFAQAGMFGVEFGVPVEQVDKALKQQGFQVKESNDVQTVYTHPKQANLTSLEVSRNSDDGTVSMCQIVFDISKTDMSGEAVLAEIEKLHGDPAVVDDFDYDYVWYFENDKALYVDVNDGQTVILMYQDGNFDDDYYWYYEDEWYW